MKKLKLIVLMIILKSSVGSAQKEFETFYKNTLDGKKVGLINKQTKDTVLRAKYDEIKTYSEEGYFNVVINNKMGVIDTNEKIVIPIKYNICSNISDGRAFVGDNSEKLALIDKSGKLLTKYLFDDASEFNDGMCGVQMNKKTGYINKSGQLVIPCKYNKASSFSEGTAVVYSDKWENAANYKVTQGKQSYNMNAGYSSYHPIIINKLGKVLYEGGANEELEYMDGCYLASKFDPGYGKRLSQIIDKTGKIIFPFSNHCELYKDENWLKSYCYDTDLRGIISFSGKELLKPKFKSIQLEKINDINYWKVFFDNTAYFYIDKEAKCVELNNVKCPN